MKNFELEVNYIPPIKNGANSIFNEKHKHYKRVAFLQSLAKEKMKNIEIFKTKLGITIENYGRLVDADNIIGGIFDSFIQRHRC